MRNIFSGTDVEREAKKRQADRTRLADETRAVGRSRRQREMDDAADERKHTLKKIYNERRAKERTDTKMIGRAKGTLLIPPKAKVEKLQPKAEPEAAATLKSEPAVVSPTAAAPAAPPSAETVYLKLLKALQAPKKYPIGVGMIARLMGEEGEGWLTQETAPKFTHLAFDALMADVLACEKTGGEARKMVSSQLIPQVGASILKTGKIIFPSQDIEPDQVITFVGPSIDRLDLAHRRARMVCTSFSDDSLVMKRGLSILEVLLEETHAAKVQEQVRLGELNAYEASARTKDTVGEMDIKNLVSQEASVKGSAPSPPPPAAAISGELTLGPSPAGAGMEALAVPVAELRERIIKDGLMNYYPLLKVSWAKRDIMSLFLKAYHYKDDFSQATTDSIVYWQSAIKDGSALGRESASIGVHTAGISSVGHKDARVDKISYTSGADAWASKQQGIL